MSMLAFKHPSGLVITRSHVDTADAYIRQRQSYVGDMKYLW